MKKLIALMTFAALVAVACTKETPLTATQAFESKIWRLSSKSVDGKAVTLSACWLDDKYAYNVSGSYEHNSGTTKCGSEGNITGNWSIENGDKTLKIVINDSNKAITYNIKSFDANKMVLTYETTDTGATFNTVEETFVPAQ